MATGPVTDDGIMACNSSFSFIMLVVLKGGNITTYTLVPYGESENPNSPRYVDQALLKSQAKLKRMLFDIDRNGKEIENTFSLDILVHEVLIIETG